jgi:hypothetical protein
MSVSRPTSPRMVSNFDAPEWIDYMWLRDITDDSRLICYSLELTIRVVQDDMQLGLTSEDSTIYNLIELAALCRATPSTSIGQLWHMTTNEPMAIEDWFYLYGCRVSIVALRL